MKKLIAALAAFAVFAPAALASTHYLKVSPSTVQAGDVAKAYGLVQGCAVGNTVTIYSKAFKGSTSHNFAGVPSVSAKIDSHHKFSKRVRIQSSTASGTYKIGARCGGGKFGSTKLTVSGGPGFY